MPRKTDRPVTRIHIMLYEADLTRLRTLYKTTTGISGAIRTMVKYCLDHIEAKLLEKEQLNDPRHETIGAQGLAPTTQPPFRSPGSNQTDP